VQGNKRRRASTASTPGSRRSARIQAAPRPQIILDSEDSEEELFVTQPKKLKFDTADSNEDRRKSEQAPEDDDVIDLADPAPPAAAAPAKHPGRVEFAAFQCAICMDNATALAVTHCGLSTSPVLKTRDETDV
jgi:hypothetical protein